MVYSPPHSLKLKLDFKPVNEPDEQITGYALVSTEKKISIVSESHRGFGFINFLVSHNFLNFVHC